MFIDISKTFYRFPGKCSENESGMDTAKNVENKFCIATKILRMLASSVCKMAKNREKP